MTGQKMCFVFGSNLAGIHGGGAAKLAREKHGAVMRKAIVARDGEFARAA